GATVPVGFSWTASDPESGLRWTQVDWNCNQPDSVLLSVPATTTSATHLIHLGNRCFQYFAAVYNQAGNGGSVLDQPLVIPRVVPGAATGLAYGRTWPTQSGSGFLGGSTRYATAAGATVTYSFHGRAVGFVTTRGPNRGKAEVWVDGVKVTTLDLRA